MCYSNSVPLKGSNINEHMNCKYKSPAYFKIKENVFFLVYLSQTSHKSVIRSIEFPINIPILYESVNIIKINENLYLFCNFCSSTMQNNMHDLRHCIIFEKSQIKCISILNLAIA